MLKLNRSSYPAFPETMTQQTAWRLGWRAYEEKHEPRMTEDGELAVNRNWWAADEQFVYAIAPRGEFWHFYLQGWAEAFDADR